MGQETQGRSTSSYPVLSKGPVGKQIEGIYQERLRQFTAGGECTTSWQDPSSSKGQGSIKDRTSVASSSML